MLKHGHKGTKYFVGHNCRVAPSAIVTENPLHGHPKFLNHVTARRESPSLKLTPQIALHGHCENAQHFQH